MSALLLDTQPKGHALLRESGMSDRFCQLPGEHGSREQLFASRSYDCAAWCSARAYRRTSKVHQ